MTTVPKEQHHERSQNYQNLWDAADADRLTDEQLAALVLAMRVASTFETWRHHGGIACLISNDTDAGKLPE